MLHIHTYINTIHSHPYTHTYKHTLTETTQEENQYIPDALFSSFVRCICGGSGSCDVIGVVARFMAASLKSGASRCLANSSCAWMGATRRRSRAVFAVLLTSAWPPVWYLHNTGTHIWIAIHIWIRVLTMSTTRPNELSVRFCCFGRSGRFGRLGFKSRSSKINDVK